MKDPDGLHVDERTDYTEEHRRFACLSNATTDIVFAKALQSGMTTYMQRSEVEMSTTRLHPFRISNNASRYSSSSWIRQAAVKQVASSSEKT